MNWVLIFTGFQKAKSLYQNSASETVAATGLPAAESTSLRFSKLAVSVHAWPNVRPILFVNNVVMTPPSG